MFKSTLGALNSLIQPSYALDTENGSVQEHVSGFSSSCIGTSSSCSCFTKRQNRSCKERDNTQCEL